MKNCGHWWIKAEKIVVYPKMSTIFSKTFCKQRSHACYFCHVCAHTRGHLAHLRRRVTKCVHALVASIKFFGAKKWGCYNQSKCSHILTTLFQSQTLPLSGLYQIVGWVNWEGSQLSPTWASAWAELGNNLLYQQCNLISTTTGVDTSDLIASDSQWYKCQGKTFILKRSNKFLQILCNGKESCPELDFSQTRKWNISLKGSVCVLKSKYVYRLFVRDRQGKAS